MKTRLKRFICSGKECTITRVIQDSFGVEMYVLESVSGPALHVFHKYKHELVEMEETEEIPLEEGTLVYYRNEWFLWYNTKDSCGNLIDLDETSRYTVHYTEVFTEEEVEYMYREESEEEEPCTALRYNDGKPRPTLIDADFIIGLAQVLEMGAKKYGDFNWQKGLPTIEILDSLQRHSLKLQSGEELDEESGLHHSLHIAANAMFIHFFSESE